MNHQGAVLSEETQAMADAVARALGEPRRLGIAFSGGVDSSTLLALAVRILGAERVLGILAVSPSLPSHEREQAHSFAESIGAELVEITTNELEDHRYTANKPDRCYWCKDSLFTTISRKVVAEHGLDAIAYGENADDALRADRPGARAADEHRILSPFAEAKLTKVDVRKIARALELSVADKPAAPCLASRIPHGDEITELKMAQVEHAESAVRALGFTDFRVRHHGDIARIELPLTEVERVVEPQIRSSLVRGVRQAGFRYVTVDLSGIQSGGFTLAELGISHG